PERETLWDRRKRRRYSPKASAPPSPAALHIPDECRERGALALRDPTRRDLVSTPGMSPPRRPESKRRQLPQIPLNGQARAVPQRLPRYSPGVQESTLATQRYT